MTSMVPVGMVAISGMSMIATGASFVTVPLIVAPDWISTESAAVTLPYIFVP